MTVFDLGKKAYAFQVNPNQDAVLFGISETSQEGLKLSLVYKRLGEHNQIIDSYTVRSNKLNRPEFDEKEARRYLKSRFRDILQQVNRLGDSNGHAKDQFLTNKAQEYIRLNRKTAELV
jgi:hypothetical protein